jgi:hypothetical protein
MTATLLSGATPFLTVPALLHKQFAHRIKYEHRERAVQRSAAKVRIGLRQEADPAIIAVHQNELLVVAGDGSVIGFQVIQAAPLQNGDTSAAAGKSSIRISTASLTAGLPIAVIRG